MRVVEWPSYQVNRGSMTRLMNVRVPRRAARFSSFTQVPLSAVCCFSLTHQLHTHRGTDGPSHKTISRRQNESIEMFSWSNNTSTSTSRVSSTYPGRRLQQQRAAVAAGAATPIQGSIRPPSSSSHTRAQHLTSYIEDPTLQRSTRRVSSGTNSTHVVRSKNKILNLRRIYFLLLSINKI